MAATLQTFPFKCVLPFEKSEITTEVQIKSFPFWFFLVLCFHGWRHWNKVFVYETKHCVLQSNILDNFCGQSDVSIQYWRLIVSVMCCQAIFMLLFLFAFIEINIKLSSGTSQPPDTDVYCHSSHKGPFYIYYSTLITIIFFPFFACYHLFTMTSCSTKNTFLPLHPQVTLQYLWEKEYQVLVFYHHPMALEVPFLWPGQMMPAPWANTTDPEKLVQFLQASVTDRRSVAASISLWAIILEVT